MVVWMHEQPLMVGQTYLAKHTTRTVRATVRAIRYGVDVNTAEPRDAAQVQMNDIAEVEFDTSLPLFFDAYGENREMGALILIDAVSNATVGAAMILAPLDPAVAEPLVHSALAQGAAFVWQRGLAEEAIALRERLRELGHTAILVDDPLIPETSLAGAVRALQLAGVTAISARDALTDTTVVALREIAGEAYFENAGAAISWAEAGQQGPGQPQKGEER
jgi:bifunctional enzyme CysN/CysC/sulfate adenylyltransferase subunit 1